VDVVAYEDDATGVMPADASPQTFLAVAARRDVDVVAYEDDATGVMPADASPQRITQITLRPRITVAGGAEDAVVEELVHQAHEECYIANSLKTDVLVEPVVLRA
jgi:organic hydroperoxide reductase OsmC/OhrA